MFELQCSYCKIIYSKTEVVKEAGVKEVVGQQVGQWSEMIERQRKEHWALMKQHITEQQETFTKLMETTHANQMKQLEAKHDRYLPIFKSVEAQ